MRRILQGAVPLAIATTILAFGIAGQAGAHGDVAPQAVDTAGLPDLGDEWLDENPWRDPANEFHALAVTVGASGYNQNCARCHGLEVVSGGLAPDLRFLEANFDGDEWFNERFKHGYTQDGITKMPAFGELLGQEAAWAIRTYIETRPDEGALDDHVARLKEIRDQLQEAMTSGKAMGDDAIAAIRSEMAEIGSKIPTGSGAPMSDSVATRAAAMLDGSEKSLHNAVETLTIGLSAAQ